MGASRAMVIGALCCLIGAAAFATGGVSGAAPVAPAKSTASASPAARAVRSKQVCAVRRVSAFCRALVVVQPDGTTPSASVNPPSGALRPLDLASAYGYLLPPSGSAWTWNGHTVAIVDSYDNPTAEFDLAVYRSQWGLPPCTSASGCFTKINQKGKAAPLPAADVGWGREIDLDIEMVSAVCPNCKIVLVEANSESLNDLRAAESRAKNRAVGASAVSNSWGGPEIGAGASGPFKSKGPAIVAASGDDGFYSSNASFPATLPTVISVGGTSLTRSNNARGWSESAWAGAGWGCSAKQKKPSWQALVVPASECATRAVADVAAIADPATGVAVFDSYGSLSGANWYQFGGTSVGAPMIAGMYALRGDKIGKGHTPASDTYVAWSANHALLNDVTSGPGAAPGYDGPTGLGSPAGLGAF